MGQVIEEQPLPIIQAGLSRHLRYRHSDHPHIHIARVLNADYRAAAIQLPKPLPFREPLIGAKVDWQFELERSVEALALTTGIHSGAVLTTNTQDHANRWLPMSRPVVFRISVGTSMERKVRSYPVEIGTCDDGLTDNDNDGRGDYFRVVKVTPIIGLLTGTISTFSLEYFRLDPTELK